MEEKQKVYIKGVQGRGEEVKQALINLGGYVVRDYNYTVSDCLYYINHNEEIRCTKKTTEIGKIIMDNYKEIKLPEKWEDGNILFSPQYKCFAIYEHKCTIPYLAVAYYCIAENFMTPYLPRIEINNYRLATPPEIVQFHELLHKHGKEWDFDKKQLVDWKWKPKEKEVYWHICSNGRLVGNVFENDEFDISLYNLGNCFCTKEEAEAMAEKIKKLLKGELIMIKQYKKKPVVVSAIQWNGSNLKEVMDFMNGKGMIKNNVLIIPTLEGTMAAEVGSYIIKGVKGECYPCRGDIFEDTYEEVK